MLLAATGCETSEADSGNVTERQDQAADETLAQSQARLVSARASEVARYLDKRHFGRFKIKGTTEGPFGEVVDWVDPHDLDPSFSQRKPPADPEVPATPEGAPSADLPKNAAFGEDIAERWKTLPRPMGTVPVLRPNFDTYVRGSHSAKTLDEFLRAIPTPQPADRDRLYGGRIHAITNIGTQGWVSYTDTAQVPNDGMSLAQLANLCWGSDPDNTLEAIEVGVQKVPGMYGDSNLHFFTYFRTAGGAQGDFVGGYNQTVAGFVPWSGSFPPGATIPTPPAGWAHERRLRAVRSGNAWWVQDFNGTTFTWLGYYPIGTGAGQIPFDLINNSACEVHWYGEVFDPTPTDWTFADMGYGFLPTTTSGAWFREMIVERSAGNVWFSTSAGSNAADTACYDASAVTASSTGGWQVSFRYGGPGGDAVGCN